MRLPGAVWPSHAGLVALPMLGRGDMRVWVGAVSEGMDSSALGSTTLTSMSMRRVGVHNVGLDVNEARWGPEACSERLVAVGIAKSTEACRGWGWHGLHATECAVTVPW